MPNYKIHSQNITLLFLYAYINMRDTPFFADFSYTCAVFVT